MDNEQRPLAPDPLAVVNANGLKLNILVQLQTSVLKFQSQLSDVTSRLSLLESNQQDLFNDLGSLKKKLSTTEPRQAHGRPLSIYEDVNRLEGRVDSLDNQMCIIQQHFQALTLTNNGVGRDDNVEIRNVHSLNYLDEQPQDYEQANFQEEEVEVNGLNIVKLEAESDNFVEADFYQFIGPTEPYDDNNVDPHAPASSSSSDVGPDEMIPVPSKRTLRRRKRYGKSTSTSTEAITKSKELVFVDSLHNRVAYTISGRKLKCLAPTCRQLDFPSVSSLRYHYNSQHARRESTKAISKSNESFFVDNLRNRVAYTVFGRKVKCPAPACQLDFPDVASLILHYNTKHALGDDSIIISESIKYKEFEDRLGHRVTYTVSEGKIQKCPACKTRMNFLFPSRLIYHYNTRHVRQDLSRCSICGNILPTTDLKEHELSHRLDQDQDVVIL